MALSNAERQARHRERVKEKLRNADTGEPLRNEFAELKDGLADDYHRTAEVWLKIVGRDVISDDARGAVEEFLAEGISYADIRLMVRMCAFTRINDLYRLHSVGLDAEAPLPGWWKLAGQLEAALRNA